MPICDQYTNFFLITTSHSHYVNYISVVFVVTSNYVWLAMSSWIMMNHVKGWCTVIIRDLLIFIINDQFYFLLKTSSACNWHAWWYLLVFLIWPADLYCGPKSSATDFLSIIAVKRSMSFLWWCEQILANVIV